MNKKAQVHILEVIYLVIIVSFALILIQQFSSYSPSTTYSTEQFREDAFTVLYSMDELPPTDAKYDSWLEECILNGYQGDKQSVFNLTDMLNATFDNEMIFYNIWLYTDVVNLSQNYSESRFLLYPEEEILLGQSYTTKVHWLISYDKNVYNLVMEIGNF